jgi:hypothetical protein
MMSKVLFCASSEAKRAVAILFDNSPPVLVEVRFSAAGTSPDWYLCDDAEQLEQILDRVSAGAELHISSVWDLKNTKGEICLRK